MADEKTAERASSGRPAGLGTNPAQARRFWHRPLVWLALLVGLPILLVGAHGAAWYLATQQIIDQANGQLRLLGRQGWTTFAETPVRGGYPWVAEVTIPGMRIADPLLEYRVERMVVRLALVRPQIVRIAVEGQQAARFGGGPLVPFIAKRGEAIVNLLTPDAADIEFDGFDAKAPSGPFTAEIFRLRLDRAALTLGANVVNATVPGLPPNWPLGPHLDRAEVAVAVQGGLPGETTAPALQAWRAGGGRIDISRIGFGADQVKAVGQAQIGLDDLLQPVVTGQIRVGGYTRLIEAAVAANLLGSRQALAMRAVLGMLAKPAEDTGPDSVDVPVSLKDRSLNVGRIPLLRTPEFVWPPGK